MEVLIAFMFIYQNMTNLRIISAFVNCSMFRIALKNTCRRAFTTSIIVVGKKGAVEDWIQEGFSEYEKRLKPVNKIQSIFLRDDEELIDVVKATKGTILALDESGKQYDSKEFSKLVYTSLDEGKSKLSFIIGGFSGLPDEIKKTYPLVSLSKMTWTHQMARLLLIEQIYRASEIYKGSAYHKD